MKTILKSVALFALAISLTNCGEKKETDAMGNTIEETTEELYKNQEYILRSIDTSKLTEDCIDYPTVEINGEDKILIVDILQKIQDEICEMKEESTEDNSLELDFKCLVSPCGETITSLKDLLQVLINEICILKGE